MPKRKASSPQGETAYVATPPKRGVARKKIVLRKIFETLNKFQVSPPKRSIFSEISSSFDSRSAPPSFALRGIFHNSVPRSFSHLSSVFSTAPSDADSALSGLSPLRDFQQEDVDKFEKKKKSPGSSRTYGVSAAFPFLFLSTSFSS